MTLYSVEYVPDHFTDRPAKQSQLQYGLGALQEIHDEMDYLFDCLAKFDRQSEYAFSNWLEEHHEVECEIFSGDLLEHLQACKLERITDLADQRPR